MFKQKKNSCMICEVSRIQKFHVSRVIFPALARETLQLLRFSVAFFFLLQSSALLFSQGTVAKATHELKTIKAVDKVFKNLKFQFYCFSYYFFFRAGHLCCCFFFFRLFLMFKEAIVVCKFLWSCNPLSEADT